MIKEGQQSVTPTLTMLFQKCWEQGIVPLTWKRDNRIYIPKPGKEDYHTEKSYRPLSLNSIVGKTYERIAAKRLVWYIESQIRIDWQQFAYRRLHNPNQALLCVTQDVAD